MMGDRMRMKCILVDSSGFMIRPGYHEIVVTEALAGAFWFSMFLRHHSRNAMSETSGVSGLIDTNACENTREIPGSHAYLTPNAIPDSKPC